MSLPGSTHQSSLPSSPLPALSWETINEQKDFYDVQDLVDPSPGLTSEKLKDRKEDDVVIFDYSLDPRYLRGGPLVEEGCPSSTSSSADDDLFFQVSKNRLLESDQFDQIIRSINNPLLELSRGSRLVIIDFPQCYDAYDCGLLNPIGEKLSLQKDGEAAFMDAHLLRVQALPGCERFRTGISLRVPFKKPPELSRSDLPEDISTLFISVPYLGKYTSRIQLGPESESVRLLDFGRLGADVPYRGVGASEEEGDDIGEILVHQARYMIFDNNAMATFRSKEDSANDQVPLHRFQERIGAFRAVIHMIANRMDLELWTLRKLQASLCKLEDGIDQMVSGVETYQDSQRVERIPSGKLPPSQLQIGTSRTEGKWKEDCEQLGQNNIRGGKQRRVRYLLTSLNKLLEASFAAISVAERQIVVLQDIHNLFLTSCRAKARDYDKRYRSKQNPFHKTSAPIPILSGNTEQIFPATLDAIDGVVHERKLFILKIRGLVENMDITRKMVFGFLGPDPGYAVIPANDHTRDIAVKDSQMNFSVALLAAVFVPFIACTLYFGMNVRGFDGYSYSTLDFWLNAGPIMSVAVLLTLIVGFWRHPLLIGFKDKLARKLSRSPRRKSFDAEKQ
ncbi:hypothetical protein HOY80DRAFT_923041 [Tuber brumale]|nr:hypothetical protein HOY80DRAFT_923041 [Tuber brumale]